jgi:hypothetical protein
MSQNKDNEATHKLWLNKKREERAKMRLCNDMQRKILALVTKATYWEDEHTFLRTYGRSAQNRARIEESATNHVRILESRDSTSLKYLPLKDQ